MTLIRTFSCLLLSYRCQFGKHTATRISQNLFQDTVIGCPTCRFTLPLTRACQTSTRFATRVFLTDDDEFDRYRISSQLLSKDRQIIKKLKSEFGPNISISVLPGQQVYVSGSGVNIESVNYAVERVLQEIQKIREQQGNVIKEKIFTDEDVTVHNEICGIMVGKGGRKMNKFVMATGLDFEITTARENYIYVSGVDAEVVRKAVILVEQRINSIRKFAGIKTRE